MIIAFYNDDDRTTGLVAHTCVLLADTGHTVAGVMSEHVRPLLPRYLERTNIPVLDASRAAEGAYDVRVIDLRSYCTPPLTPDVWILPITRVSLARALDATDRIEGRVILLGIDGFVVHYSDLPHHLFPGVRITQALPFSRALDRAWREREIVWNDPQLATSPGAAGLRDTLAALLDRALHPCPWDFFRTEEWVRAGSPMGGPDVAASSTVQDADRPTQAPVAALPAPAPERQLSDPGLAALLDRTRSLVTGTASTQSPSEARLARSIGSRTVGEWLVSLTRTGLELACGAACAEQIVREILPKAATAKKAGIHLSTLKRLLAQPGRARLATLMRLAVVAGRVDLFEVRERPTADPVARVPPVPPFRVVFGHEDEAALN